MSKKEVSEGLTKIVTKWSIRVAELNILLKLIPNSTEKEIRP